MSLRKFFGMVLVGVPVATIVISLIYTKGAFLTVIIIGVALIFTGMLIKGIDLLID